MSHFLARALAVAVLTTAACAPADDKPERALARFLNDVRRGRAKPAWSALTAASRQTLKDRHETLARAARGSPSEDVADILFGDLRLRALNPHESIVVVGPLGDRVRLRVTVQDGESAEVYMAREDGEWKVDLVRSLAPLRERAAVEAPTADENGGAPPADRSADEPEGDPSADDPEDDPSAGDYEGDPSADDQGAERIDGRR